MALEDPFDKVLQELGLRDRIQSIDPIRTANVTVPPPPNNTRGEVICRIRVRGGADLLDIPLADRGEIALKVVKFIHSTHETATRIRPVSLILDLDGTVQAKPVDMLPAGNPPGVYPARYQIPTSTIVDLPLQQQVWRAEKFALGTLLYELLSGHTIFEGQSDAEVQNNYRTATFPDLNELPFPSQHVIYACWSAEFGKYIALGKFKRYVHDNPVRFGLQVTAAVVSTAALITVPVLGAVGFSALGPVAGSAAAGWQAAAGVVEAGSVFAFCQSAAMGGAAAAGLTGTGVAGAAVAVAGTGLPDLQNLRGMFIWKFRKASNNS